MDPLVQWWNFQVEQTLLLNKLNYLGFLELKIKFILSEVHIQLLHSEVDVELGLGILIQQFIQELYSIQHVWVLFCLRKIQDLIIKNAVLHAKLYNLNLYRHEAFLCLMFGLLIGLKSITRCERMSILSI